MLHHNFLLANNSTVITTRTLSTNAKRNESAIKNELGLALVLLSKGSNSIIVGVYRQL